MADRGPQEPIITYELWSRLRRFDGRCFIAVERRQPTHVSPFASLPRIWMGHIRPIDAQAWARVDAEHPYFTELIRLLVEKGEARGWHRSRG